MLDDDGLLSSALFFASSRLDVTISAGVLILASGVIDISLFEQIALAETLFGFVSSGRLRLGLLLIFAVRARIDGSLYLLCAHARGRSAALRTLLRRSRFLPGTRRSALSLPLRTLLSAEKIGVDIHRRLLGFVCRSLLFFRLRLVLSLFFDRRFGGLRTLFGLGFLFFGSYALGCGLLLLLLRFLLGDVRVLCRLFGSFLRGCPFGSFFGFALLSLFLFRLVVYVVDDIGDLILCGGDLFSLRDERVQKRSDLTGQNGIDLDDVLFEILLVFAFHYLPPSDG